MTNEAQPADPTIVGKRVILCVTGSVAAYKSVQLARLLVTQGASVQVLMTRAAQRFVGADTFAAIVGQRPFLDLFGQPGEPHVTLARESDLVVVAPATADLLARAAQGSCADLVSALLLCARCPVLVAPAMHPKMYEHAFTQENLQRLARLPHWYFAGPAWGAVASGEYGLGRQLEPEELMRRIREILIEASERPVLAGRHVVITAGPTVEDIDPVRCITNRSSGKMGYALCTEALRAGARVTLISGPVHLPSPAGADVVRVRSALEMQQALERVLGPGRQGADAVLMAAAVSDFRPAQTSEEKIKRAGERELRLLPNPDLLAGVARGRAGASPYLVGFALETVETEEALLALADQKRQRKGVDAIVANRHADALEGDSTVAHLVDAGGRQRFAGSKAEVARGLIQRIAEKMPAARDTGAS